MSYALTWRDNVAVFVFTGALTDDDLAQANEEVYSSPNFKEMRGQLINFLAVDAIEITPHGVRLASIEDSNASKINPDVKVAFVATKRLLIEYSRMYKLTGIQLEWDVRIFVQMDEALEWLYPKGPN